MVLVRTSLLYGLLCLVLTANPGEAQQINFSYSSPIGTESPLWIANDIGFFKNTESTPTWFTFPAAKA